MTLSQIAFTRGACGEHGACLEVGPVRRSAVAELDELALHARVPQAGSNAMRLAGSPPLGFGAAFRNCPRRFSEAICPRCRNVGLRHSGQDSYRGG
jgi:hypothetical protein